MTSRTTTWLATLAALLAVSLPSLAGTVTVCQCNIYVGGRYTEQDESTVTYDTAKRFAQWVATINPPGSANPPISVIGMQEVIAETDRAKMEQLLEQYTGVAWSSVRTAQGVNNGSGIGFFWRPDLIEHRLTEWNLGSKTLEVIDNGYNLKFAGRLFRKVGTDEAFGLFTGKLLWGGAIINGHEVTEEERRQEAVRLKNWIREGDPGSPGMSSYRGAVRVVTTDLNTDTGTSTWNEMNLEFADPSSQHTHNSFSGSTAMDLFGKRLDYIWWDYDSGAEVSGGFAAGPTRSSHVGSDHRSVYATINLHPVDLVPPAVSITAPDPLSRVSGTAQITASATDASGIYQVEFFVNGATAGIDTTAPYEVPWATAGLTTGLYTLTATATDASSNRVQATSSPVTVWVGPEGSEPSIGQVRQLADGSTVGVFGKIVTASFGSTMYIEEPGRSAGIKVTNVPSLPVGTAVSVGGKLGTLNYEREISASAVATSGVTDVPLALGMNNLQVGGRAENQYTPGIYGALGKYNVGLLVRTWGTVVADTTGFYLYIDDGARKFDGFGPQGIRVDVSSLVGWNAPLPGSYVEVTGVSSTFLMSGKVQRKVKARSADDIRILY